jgi:pimeloyl-ACP methyl ester carboxylesterase
MKLPLPLLTLQAVGSLAGECTNVTFTTNVTAENYYVNIHGDVTLDSTVTDFLANMSAGQPPFLNTTQTIGGSYKIAGRLCEPTRIVQGIPRTLQFLVHGLGYKHSYWSGFDNYVSSNGSTYSYVDYASVQGYYTLAIDRLGSGLSDHPDPVNMLQYPLEIEVMHSILTQMRGGTPFSDPYDHIVYTSHSYGSAFGNYLAAKHPDDFEDMVLTGWGSKAPVLLNNPGLQQEIPAANQSAVWTGLPAGYVAVSTTQGIVESLYAG